MTRFAELRRELSPTLRLALPMMVGQVSQMLIGLTDNAFVGRLGAAPLAAAALTQGIFGLVFVVSLGVLLGPGVFAARDHGAGDDASCLSWLRHGRLLALGVGALAFALLLGVSTQLARLGQPAEVVALARPFFILVSASIVPALYFQVQRQFAESVGRPWGPMTILLGDVALNAFLNWLLVFGHGGSPALGLVGAAWSTLLARVTAVIVLGVWLGKSRQFTGLQRARRLPFERARMTALLRLGVPAGIALLFETGAFGASALMMGWLGTVPLAAHQLALGCAALTFMVPLALSHAVSMRVSRALGEKRAQALRPIAFGALATGALFMLCTASTFALAGRSISGWFTTDGEVAALAAALLVVAAIFQIFDGIQVVSVGALRGLGDVRVPMGITFVAYWLVSLPLGYFLAFHSRYGAQGLWLGLAAGLGSAAVFLALRLRRKTAPQMA